jgi:hypothetical protein
MFVFDSVLLNTVINDKSGAILKANMPFMTERTWSEEYEPMYVEVMIGLEEEGLCDDDDGSGFERLISNTKDKNIVICQYERVFDDDEEMYYSNLKEFFGIALKKLYCKKFAKVMKAKEKEEEEKMEEAERERDESVFTRPTKITDELCKFLGKPAGTLMSRSDVTRGVMDYVKKHSLNNKQDINPDAALRKLLSVSETEKVTILNLQRFLKTHYIQAPVVVA